LAFSASPLRCPERSTPPLLQLGLLADTDIVAALLTRTFPVSTEKTSTLYFVMTIGQLPRALPTTKRLLAR
jgi:hypothetical protein